MGEEFLSSKLPVVLIDLKADKNCNYFENQREYINNTYSSYFSEDQLPEDAAAWLDLQNLRYEDYLEKIKSRYKSKSALRDVRKAYSQGYVCKPFSKTLFMPDIVAIHHSKKVRGGGPISGFFRRTLEEMGGAPKEYRQFQYPGCSTHYGFYWGIFVPEPGHKQGSILTNERLLGYAFIRRVGDVAIYSQLVGHGDYLKQGIVYALHFAIVEWFCKRDNPYTQGVKHLMHGRYWDGGDGRILWRKKTGFEPAKFIFCDKTTNNQCFGKDVPIGDK